MASGFEIFGLISAIITITDTTIEVYSAIKDLHELPEAFQQVNYRLPLVKEILEDVKKRAKNASSSEAKALKGVLESCEKKAKELQKIFIEIAKESTSSKFIISVYRPLVLKLGKKARVEDLMDGILNDLGLLAAHQVFQTAMQRQVKPLEKAREELANVPPSLPDSEFEEKPGAANQYGDGNRQNNVFGGTQNNIEGHYFDAKGDQNFGTIPNSRF